MISYYVTWYGSYSTLVVFTTSFWQAMLTDQPPRNVIFYHTTLRLFYPELYSFQI